MVVPYAVIRLGPDDRRRILEHLLALDAEDRAVRFGAATDDAALERYVGSFDLDGDVLLGVAAQSGALIGLAHVAFRDGIAELGVSVARGQRERGLASTLSAAALRAAQDAGAREFRFHCAANNEGMRRIAQRLGMVDDVEGSEVIARRLLNGEVAGKPELEAALGVA